MRALSLRLVVLALVVLAAAAELCTLTVSTSRPSRAKKNMAKLTFTVTNNRKKSVPNGAFELDLPAGAVYVSSEWTKGARGSVSVSGQTVTWTNLAFKPRQKRKLSVVVGVAGLTGTLAFTGEAYKLNGGTPYRDDDSVPGCEWGDATATVIIA